jgi:uncharacterized protein (TIGR03435 family)
MNADKRRFENAAGLIVLMAGLGLGQSFEVASVKPNTDWGPNTLTCLPGGERFRVRNMPLLFIIGAAYNVPNRQISGMLEKTALEDYDIEAKADRPASREQMMGMLRDLLEDRFKLKVRRETREMKAQALLVAKTGAKLDQNRDGAELFMDRIGRNKWGFRNMPMPMFANVLSSWVDDTVVDQTRLPGTYNFTIEAALERAGQPTADPSGPSLRMALEGLGLRLESKKMPVEILVVDHIERLSGN